MWSLKRRILRAYYSEHESLELFLILAEFVLGISFFFTTSDIYTLFVGTSSEAFKIQYGISYGIFAGIIRILISILRTLSWYNMIFWARRLIAMFSVCLSLYVLVPHLLSSDVFSQHSYILFMLALSNAWLYIRLGRYARNQSKITQKGEYI